MALFGPGTNTIGTDAISQALARRQQGMPTAPVMEQRSQAAPGEAPPVEPNITLGRTASPMPDTLAQMQQRAGQATGQPAQPAGQGGGEIEMILRALIDRLKQIGKSEREVQQFRPQATNDWESNAPIPGMNGQFRQPIGPV